MKAEVICFALIFRVSINAILYKCVPQITIIISEY